MPALAAQSRRTPERLALDVPGNDAIKSVPVPRSHFALSSCVLGARLRARFLRERSREAFEIALRARLEH
ncbi:MAG: hypothetical protein ABR946_09775 [Solirubrobacteraceae bacterium]